MEVEVWKDILEVGGMYQISNFGRVRSKDRLIVKSNGRKLFMPQKIMSRLVGNQGYLSTYLQYMGKTRGFVIHRLVAKYFLDNPENCDVVKFRIEDKNNCRYDNLYWMSSAQYKKNRKISYHYVDYDEISEQWDVIINNQHFASYSTKQKAETVLNMELERRKYCANAETIYRRNIIPQRVNKFIRNIPVFIYG